MTRALLDANVFLYALGAEHPYREPCRGLLVRLARGEIDGEISVEILQEVVHVLRRRSRPAATDRARTIISSGITLHGFDPADLTVALTLLDQHPGLAARDAVHAATALNRDLKLIVSTDRAFDRIPGLERIDPADPDRLASS